ncbi:MAG: hypothetical protein RLW68_00765 [Devosia marina]|uniref:Pam3-gp28 family putative phage holin n=1 Tax=Devosia marina TaxID=2683198 RepID=UPI0032F04D4D
MTTLPASAAILLAEIRRIETGRKDARAYETIYGHNEGNLPKPITRMSLDEVISAGPGWTRAYRSSAAGAYQFMHATLKDLKASLGLVGNETFTPAFQDRLGLALLKRRGFEGFMAGTIGRNAFGLGLAREWASFPVLADTKGAHRNVARGETYYAGDRLNKALVPPETVETILTQVKLATGTAPQPSTPSPSPTTPKRKTLMDWFEGLIVNWTVGRVSSQLKDNPKMTNVISGVIRHVLTTFGGGLIGSGLIGDNEIGLIAGAVATLIGVAWSIVEKRLKA